MTPRLPSNDEVDRGKADTELLGQMKSQSAGIEQIPYLENLGFRQNAVRVRRSARRGLTTNHGMLLASCLTTLAHLVSHVIVICSKPQMPRVAAPRMVAAMQAVKSIRNRAARKLVRYSVGIASFSVNPKSAIAFVASCLGPRPAGGWTCGSVNLFPEPLLDCLKKWHGLNGELLAA